MRSSVRQFRFGILAAIVGIAATFPEAVVSGEPEILSAPPAVTAWKAIRYGNPRALTLRSQVGLVIDERKGVILYARDIDKPRPIASLTKLLTVVTILHAGVPLDSSIEITDQDRDHLKGSRSSLPLGTTLTRAELMQIALVASDNRAAARALAQLPRRIPCAGPHDERKSQNAGTDAHAGGGCQRLAPREYLHGSRSSDARLCHPQQPVHRPLVHHQALQCDRSKHR